ncbi:MAG: DUF748 domain-containing protein [Paludibacter sp.]|nr:DUF748 domain-containing protein [Paludibacter sp.]
MNHKHKLIKAGSIVVGIIFLLVILNMVFISPVTKYLIEKYDEQITGRKITMDWVTVNPLTGYVHIGNLKIHEFRSDSLFISAKSLNVTVSLHKLLSNNLEFTSVELNQPVIMVDENRKVFNFNDIILKFTPKKKNAHPSKLHVNILGIKITDGIIHYHERTVPVNYFIKNLNIDSPGKRFDSDSINVKYSFVSGTRPGTMKGIFAMNVKNLNYKLDVIVHTFDLKVLEPYIKDLKNYGSFSANLEANLKAKGNFKDAKDVTISGMLAINEFHFGKSPHVDYGSFDKLQLAIFQLSPKNNKYLFDSASITHPCFVYERYDHFDNILQMFGKFNGNHLVSHANTGNFNLLITIGNYIALLSKNFFHSDYKINRLAVYHGDFTYNDYTLSEKFAIQVKPVSVISDSIDKHRNRVSVNFKAGIKPSGSVLISLSINPKDSGDFDLSYHLQHLPATLINPYLITYTSYPLDRGIIELNGAWKVRNGIIKSRNHLEIIDPRLGERIHNSDTKWLPAGLVMSIIRDRGNVIDYQIPITGNLKRPAFHLKDVLVNALENIVVKPATTPYRFYVKKVEADIEKSLFMKWEMHQSALNSKQIKFVDRLAKFLSKNPEASIMVHQKLYTTKEKEYCVLFEAKKRYYMIAHHKNSLNFDKNDSSKVDEMSIRNKSFTKYLDKQTKGKLLFTVQDKSVVLLGTKMINHKLTHLNNEREHRFMENFSKKGVEKQIKFTASETVIPFNGYSFYKITYKGEYPASLLKAYRKMNELNNDDPRKEYIKKRNNNTN